LTTLIIVNIHEHWPTDFAKLV